MRREELTRYLDELLGVARFNIEMELVFPPDEATP